MKQAEYENFVRFKLSYPKRNGSNPWGPAEKKFEALVKSGIDPEKIIAGAKQFAYEEGVRGKVGTEFIPMAVTWLNQRRYNDYQAPLPDGTPDKSKFWDDVLTSYKKYGRWSRWAGPDLDSPACQCPQEMLEKHGLWRVGP
jgi:hypothetical protein